jgi:hypothetical protein
MGGRPVPAQAPVRFLVALLSPGDLLLRAKHLLPQASPPSAEGSKPVPEPSTWQQKPLCGGGGRSRKNRPSKVAGAEAVRPQFAF